MSLFIWLAALILISVLAGLVRIFKGPTGADRMLAAQLLGTGGVAILLILAFAMQVPAFENSAWIVVMNSASLIPSARAFCGVMPVTMQACGSGRQSLAGLQ